MVILAVGVVPESTLAEEAGLALGVKKAIKVNAHMQTSEPDIYAVGDAVEVAHFVTREKLLFLWQVLQISKEESQQIIFVESKAVIKGLRVLLF